MYIILAGAILGYYLQWNSIDIILSYIIYIRHGQVWVSETKSKHAYVPEKVTPIRKKKIWKIISLFMSWLQHKDIAYW